MSDSTVHRVWFVVALVLALALSACGVNMSGEPKVIDEIEILPQPTQPPTQTPAPTAEDAAAEEEATAPADEPADSTPEAPAAAGDSLANLDAADFDQGFQVYLAECASCHGAQDGVGPPLAGMAERAAERVEGQSAADYLYQSIVDPAAYVVEGYQNIMPGGYADQLSEQELNSLVKFMLEFTPESMMAGTGANQASVPPADDASETTGDAAPEETLTVRGRLVQGTIGGDPLPGDLPLDLYVLDSHGELVDIYETTSTDDHTFEFTDVARGRGYIYLVQTDYADVPQGAQIPSIQGNEQALETEIILYERTTDRSSVAVRWAQMLINFAPIEEFGLEVWLRLELANTGDEIVATDEVAANNWPVSVEIELPVGAFGIQPMQTEGSQRYEVIVEDGVPIVKDTWPLRPGQTHSITVAYYLPYSDGAVLEQGFGYPVLDATVLVPNDTVTFASDQLDTEGDWRYRVMAGGARVSELAPGEEIDPERDFSLVRAHDLLQPLRADDHLVFELIGTPTRTLDVMTADSSSGGSDTDPLPYILAGAGLAVIALAGVLWWRQRGAPEAPVDTWQPPDASAGKEAILKTIADLDNAYEAGFMDEETYLRRRALLKERLIPLMDDDES